MLFKGYGAKVGLGNMRVKAENRMVLGQFIDQIETKCTEAEQRIAQIDNRISLSHKAFYILIAILIALSSFLVCMIVANVEFLHSWLIWRMVAACGLIAILGITMVMAVMRILKI